MKYKGNVYRPNPRQSVLASIDNKLDAMADSLGISTKALISLIHDYC